MIEGGEHHDSLEELFTLQNTEELKVIVRVVRTSEKILGSVQIF